MIDRQSQHPFSKYRRETSGHLKVDPFSSQIGLLTTELFTKIIGIDPTEFVESLTFTTPVDSFTSGSYSGDYDAILINLVPKEIHIREHNSALLRDFFPVLAVAFQTAPDELTNEQLKALRDHISLSDEINRDPNTFALTGRVLTLLHELQHDIFDHSVVEVLRAALDIPKPFFANLDSRFESLMEEESVKNEILSRINGYDSLVRSNANYDNFQDFNVDFFQYFNSIMQHSENERAFIVVLAYINGLEEIIHRLSEKVLHTWFASSKIERIAIETLTIRQSPIRELTSDSYTLSSSVLIPDDEVVTQSSQHESKYNHTPALPIVHFLRSQFTPLFSFQAFREYVQRHFPSDSEDLVSITRKLPWDQIAANSAQVLKDIESTLSPFALERDRSESLNRIIEEMKGELDFSRQVLKEFSWFDTHQFEMTAPPLTYTELIQRTEKLFQDLILETEASVLNGRSGTALTDRELNDYLFSTYLAGICDLIWHADMKMHSYKQQEAGQFDHATYFDLHGEYMQDPEILHRHWWKYYLPPSPDLALLVQTATSAAELQHVIQFDLLPAITDKSRYLQAIKDRYSGHIDLAKEHSTFLTKYRQFFKQYNQKILSVL